MSLLSVFRHHRRHVLWVIALLFVGSGSLGLAQSAAEPGKGKVALGVVNGAIDPGSGEFIKSAISRAQKAKYEALVIQLDTPGGLVSVTREIVQAMLESRTPVVVYVAPSAARAGSAGVFITLAAHVAAMAPTTNIGAAHPVTLGGGGQKKGDEEGRSQDEVMAEKMVNDLSAFIEAIASERGRNVEWAISAVRESESIPAEKAVELGVVDLIAPDLSALLLEIDGREVLLGPGREPQVLHTANAQIEELKWSLRHRFLHVIGDPTLASILLSLGALGVLLELYNPGALVPGIAGVIALLLGVIGMAALPVNIGAAVLLVLGIGLFVAEVFVSAYGLMGLAGAACFAAGGVLLVDNTGENFMADPDFGVSPAVFLPTAFIIALVALAVGYQAVRAFRLKPIAGETGLVDQEGQADSALEAGQRGKVFVAGELWNAVSAEPIAKGERVRVLEVKGLTLRVERVG